MKQYLSFGIPYEQYDADIDLNDYRVQPHICALIRGGGSTSETLVCGFVMGKLGHFKSFAWNPSIEDAWRRLDPDQQEMVYGFRAMMNKTKIAIDQADTPQLFYRWLCKEEYERIESEYLEKHNMYEEDMPLEAKIDLAKQAVANVAEVIQPQNDSDIWTIEEYDDEDY